MNTPQSHSDNPHDWHDALIDRSLAEIIGGETPPDLSEKILAAASANTSTVTLADAPRHLPTSKRKHWAMFAAAACLLLSVGTWLLVSQPRYRRVNRSYAKVEQTEVQQRQISAPQNSNRNERLRSVESSKDDDASRFVSKSEDPMMAVTPHIIIQEEEEERLGIATEEEGDARSLAPTATDPSKADEYLKSVVRDKDELMSRTRSESLSKTKASSEDFGDGFVPSSNMGLKGLINDDYAGEGQGGEGGEGAGYAQAGTPIATPDSTPQYQHFYADVDAEPWGLSRAEKSRSRGQRIDAAPGSAVEETLQESASARVGDVPILGKVPSVARRFRNTGEEQDAEVYSFGLQFVPSHPSVSRDQYTPIHENPFVKAIGPDAVSTFSIDVDTASYANVRQFLTQSRQLPPPDAVRIEELINYFNYDYAGPTDSTPFAAHMEVAACPWNNEHRLARIAIKGKEIDREQRPQSNLVFLIDVSGSMNEPNKLPLLVEGMKLLTRELGENDKVAIVVYASTEGVVLESTRGGEQTTILAALNRLQAGGSTAGGAGINRAYQIALDNFIEGATNRVILCTDGDFNVGVTSTDDLTRLAEQKAKTGVFLTVLGFGRGNLNDAMMESISGKGNGNYHYVDSLTEARKVLVEEMTGTLITIAKDVKIQVEFNPAKVAGYRLIGYENRMLATEDFNDDKKDAGEIGAGHTVTALYEIVPAGKEVSPPKADPLKYQQTEQPLAGLATEPAKPQAASNELLTLKLRYKLPDADKSTKLEFPITDNGKAFAESTKDFQFAAAAASFGMLLRNSQHQGDSSFDAVSQIAQSAISNDPHNYRTEFLELVRIAKQLSGEQPSSTADQSTTEGP